MKAEASVRRLWVVIAKRCLDAAAMFLTSPGLVPEVVEFSAAADIVAMPGALRPEKAAER